MITVSQCSFCSPLSNMLQQFLVFYVIYIISPLEGHRSTYGEGMDAFCKAECAYLSLWKLRTRWRTSAVASMHPCCGMPCVWPCISQLLHDAPAVGSTAPHRRAAVVYLPPPPWTAVNKWRRTDSRGSMGTLTLGIADGGHGLALHLPLLTQLLSFF